MYVNKAFERLTGYRADEAIGRNCNFLQGNDTNTNKIDEIQQHISNSEPSTTTLLNYKKDGTTFMTCLLKMMKSGSHSSLIQVRTLTFRLKRLNKLRKILVTGSSDKNMDQTSSPTITEFLKGLDDVLLAICKSQSKDDSM